jgi:hypothetical protein
MKHSRSTVLAVSALLAIASQGLSQTIFDDTFGSSSLNSGTPSAPTTSSTSYQIVGTKATTSPSIGTGDLHLSQGTTSGNGYEVQALFTATPVTLATVGDYILLNVTFTDTGGFLSAANGALSLGLYNSGGVGPLAGGITSLSATTAPTGGAQNWLGYVGQLQLAHQYINTRAAQTGTANNNQDVTTGGGVSATKGYNFPAPSHVGSQNATLGALAASSIYTLSLEIQLNGSGGLDFTENLYNGTGTGGTAIANALVTGTTASPLTTTFDALAFGLYASSSQSTVLDINEIKIDALIQVPEPSTFALAGLGLIILGARFRRNI